MGKTKYRSDPTAAVILLTILAAIIFYLFSVPEISRVEILGDVSDYNNTWLSAIPGAIDVDSSSTGFREIGLPTTTVSNTLGSDSLLLSNQFSVAAGVYSQDMKTMAFIIDDPNLVSTSNIAFTVSSKRGGGTLTVSVNGQEVFSSQPVLTERVSINIPLNTLQAGTNTVDFEVSSPGIKFWQKNEYLLTSTNVGLSKYASKTAYVSHSFSLSSEEVSNSEGAEINMFTKENSPGNLEISLNGATLFKGKPQTTFQLDIPVESLSAGQNTLSFGVDEGGEFDLSFIKLTIDTETLEGGSNYFFTIGSTDWKRVRSDVFTCELLIRKTSGAETVVTQLNAFSRSYSFAGGEVRVDVCDQLEEGQNKLTLSASEDLDLALVSVGIRP